MIITTIAIVTGMVLFTRSSTTNSTVVETSESIEELGFNRILESGNLPLLKGKLDEMRSKRFDPTLVPVILDNSNRVIELADVVLTHPDLEEDFRTDAIRAKLHALETVYFTAHRNELKDPFIAEQLLSSAQSYFEDEDRLVARDARLSHSKGVVLETIRKSSLGSFDRVTQSFVNLINEFPNDRQVATSIRQSFVQLRAFNSNESVKLAAEVARVAGTSNSEATEDLVRFMKDIIVLHDTGIGNLRKITSIIVDDTAFMACLDELNSKLDTGPTVVTQLDNAIEFFERQRKYDMALQLCKKILANAEKRTHPAAAEMAKTIGKNGVDRNSLLNDPWDFETTDFFGNEITQEQFSDRVVLIIIFPTELSETANLNQAILGLASSNIGKAIDMILVEITDSNQAPVSSENKQLWRTIQSSEDSPHKYLTNCPTRRFPYGILIDKNGKVDSINITLSNVKTRIGYLLSRN